MAVAGWAPFGTASDPKRWRYDLKGGWLPPGEMGSLTGTQLHMPPGFDPQNRAAGWQMVMSPPGVPAPVGAINYTPSTKEVHAPGIPAPVDQMNLSAVPAGQSMDLTPPPSTGMGGDSGPYMQGTYTDDLARQLMNALGDWSSAGESGGAVGTGADTEQDVDGFGGMPNTHISPGRVTATPPDWGGYSPAGMDITRGINPGNPTPPSPPGVDAAAGVLGAAAGAVGAAGSALAGPPQPQAGPPPQIASIVQPGTSQLGAPAPSGASSGASSSPASLPPIDRSGDATKFFASVMPYARQFEQQTGIPAQIAAAMAASESNYGRAPGNMLFGVKYTGAPGTHSTGPQATWEQVNGQHVNTTAEFEAFDTPQAAFQGLARTLSQPRYAEAMANKNDPNKFVQLLNQAGYATDSNWANGVIIPLSQRALAAEGKAPNTNAGGGAATSYDPHSSGATLPNWVPITTPDGQTHGYGLPDPDNPGQYMTDRSGQPIRLPLDPKQYSFTSTGGHVWAANNNKPDEKIDMGEANDYLLGLKQLEMQQQQLNKPNLQTFTDPNTGVVYGYNQNTPNFQPVALTQPGEKYLGFDNTSGRAVIQGKDGSITSKDVGLSAAPINTQQGLYQNGQIVDATRPDAPRPMETAGRGLYTYNQQTRSWEQTKEDRPDHVVVGGRYIYQISPDGGTPTLVGSAPRDTVYQQGPDGAIYEIDPNGGKDPRQIIAGKPDRETVNGTVLRFDKDGNPTSVYSDPMKRQQVVGDQIVEYDPDTHSYKKVYQAPRQPINLGNGHWLIPSEMKMNMLPGSKLAGQTGTPNAYATGEQYGQAQAPQQSGWDVSGPNDYNAFSTPGRGQDVGAGAEMPQEMPQIGGNADQPPGGWTPPVPAQDVVGTGNKFGQQVDMEGVHKGLDFQAVQGTPAIAPADGIVVAVQNKPDGLGQQVLIKDAEGQIHTLSHMDTIQVQEGDQVRAGQPVGTVGSTGAGSTGPHMDYRVQGPQGEYRNPEPLAGSLAEMPTVTKAPVGTGADDKYWTGRVGDSDGFGGGATDYYSSIEGQIPGWNPRSGDGQGPLDYSPFQTENSYGTKPWGGASQYGTMPWSKPPQGQTTPAASSPFMGPIDQSLYGPNTNSSPSPIGSNPNVPNAAVIAQTAANLPPSPANAGSPSGDNGYNEYSSRVPSNSSSSPQQAMNPGNVATSGYGAGGQETQAAAQAMSVQNQQLDLQRQNLAQQYQYQMAQLQQQYQFHQDDLTYQRQALQLQDQWRAADRQVTEQQGELNRQMQLLVQGSEAQREKFAVTQSALKNPWLQQLTGMAPGWAEPGGPGAAKNPTQGIINPQGWIPNQGITGAGQDVGVGNDSNTPFSAPNVGGQGSITPSGYGYSNSPASAGTSSLTGNSAISGAVAPQQPAAAPAQSSSAPAQSYNPYGSMFPAASSAPASASPSGVVYQDPNMNWGQWFQQSQPNFDPTLGDKNPEAYKNGDYIQQLKNYATYTGKPLPASARQAFIDYYTGLGLPPEQVQGVLGYYRFSDPAAGPMGPNGLTLPALPALPDWNSYMGMTPFERAAMRTKVEATGTAWEDYINQMREQWAGAGGPTQAPGMTALAAARQTPRDYLNNSQIAETFGNTADEYWNQQQRGWSPAAASSVSLIA